MKLLTIAACLTLAWASRVAAANPAPTGQTGASTCAGPCAQSKRPSHRHKRYSRRQPGQKAPTPDRISEIQASLAREGYYQGDPNGKMDSNTVVALQKFQSANDLEPSGRLDAPTLQKLGLGSDIAGVAAPKPLVPSCCSIAPATAAPPSGAAGPSCCATPSNSQQQPKASKPAGDLAATTNASTGAAASDPKPADK